MEKNLIPVRYFVLLLVYLLVILYKEFGYNFEKKDNYYLAQVACSIDKNEFFEFYKAKINLEHDINNFVSNLNLSSKNYLPNWDRRFSKFKHKIDLIRPYIKQLKKNKSKNIFLKYSYKSNSYTLKDEPFIYTLLGLKPITTQEINIMFLPKIKEELDNYMPLKLLRDSYPEDIYFDFINLKEQDRIIVFAINKDPIIPLKFITQSYKNKDIDISLEFKENFIDKFNIELAKKWIKNFEISTQSSKIKKEDNDEQALMLGLQPVSLKQRKEHDLAKATALFKNPQNFRQLFIPGFVWLGDTNPYIILYSKLLEYLWISLLGTKEYIKVLGKRIIENLPQDNTKQEDPFSASCKLLKKVISQSGKQN